MFFGNPTTNPLTSYSFTSSWILSMPNWPAPSSTFTVSMPWAVHPSASLIAMPTVLDPTSNPIVLTLFSLRFHERKTLRVLLGFRPVPTFGSNYVHHHVV